MVSALEESPSKKDLEASSAGMNTNLSFSGRQLITIKSKDNDDDDDDDGDDDVKANSIIPADLIVHKKTIRALTKA